MARDETGKLLAIHKALVKLIPEIRDNYTRLRQASNLGLISKKEYEDMYYFYSNLPTIEAV